MIKNKKLLVTIIPLLLTAPLFYTKASSEEWTTPDKKLHLKYGVVIGGVSTIALNFAEYDEFYMKGIPFKITRPLTASLFCTGIGAAKEVYDEIDYGGADYKDFLVTGVGCFTSSYLVDYGLNLDVREDYVHLGWKKEF